MRAIHRGERKHKEGRKAEGARGGGGRAEEGAGCARVACSVGGGVDQEGAEGRGGINGDRRSPVGSVTAGGRSPPTLLSLASPRLAHSLSFPCPPSTLSQAHHLVSLIISIPQQHRAEPRETETISLTLSVARDTCVPPVPPVKRAILVARPRARGLLRIIRFFQILPRSFPLLFLAVCSPFSLSLN